MSRPSGMPATERIPCRVEIRSKARCDRSSCALGAEPVATCLYADLSYWLRAPGSSAAQPLR